MMSGSCRTLCRSGAAIASARVCFGQERVNNEAPVSKFSPTNPIRIFRPNPYIEIAFDVRTRNPVYVIECLEVERNGEQRPRLKRPNFFEEKTLPEEFRSRPSHYKNSGYDRGHLAAAGNYTDKTSDILAHTFNLINVSPTEHTMNFKIWAALERWTKQVAKDHAEDGTTYIVSGPLWMPSQRITDKIFAFHYNAIGNPPSVVSVPTHFFKVIVVIDHKSGQITDYSCFVVPNEPPPTEYNLDDYLVPWTNLEAVTGLHFFPSLVKADPGWKKIADALSDQVSRKSRGLLMLTDGSSSSAPKNQKWFRGQSPDLLRHLCSDGKCRRKPDR